ncbi:MAG: murein L,D-transpeptidase [Verrucomicrobia bacterium]|nr:MAG: murein L,D-transpeptidase [Verrucomicrobiota bacterium]
MFALQSNNREVAQGSLHFPNNCAILGLRSHRVRVLFRFAIIAILISSGILPAAARKKPRTQTPHKANIEAATRLQIFLDRANFSPGKLDGTYNEFTWKALALYRQSRGEQPQPPPAQGKTKSNVAPDITGLDLDNVGPVFVPYTVTDADLASVGPLPSSVPAQAKLKFLPYRDAADAIAEKFHSDVHFLEQLNPGKMKTIKAGDQLKVPNVEQFELGGVKEIKPGSERNAQPANDVEYQPEPQSENADKDNQPKKDETASTPIVIKIDTKINMLGVFQGEKLIAAYPVTIGSAHTASPIGEWKVRGIAKMPPFRYDKEMLQHGQRSGNFHLLPPGPRNPVGVMWIALNKKGIGIHGTNEPGSIGRAASHGCIRLANWDVVRLATKIKPGDNVSIH